MSRVCEPVRVGVTGGGGCGCGLGICNPSLTRTRDTGSRVLPGESRIFKTHTNHPQTTTAHHNTKRARPPTNHHGCPLSKSTNNEEHTHARPSPTVTPNEYDRPRTATDNPLTTWDVYPNDSRLTTTHHTKRAPPPTNYTNRPQTTTAHYDLKRARPPTKNKERLSLAPTNNNTKWARTTTMSA
jgi:hypothetical protein